jgi:hypothetical protein
MVNSRQGPNNNRNRRGQQIPPPPNPNMEQFIAAQMQLLQGLTASVQQIEQNQQNQQHQQQQQYAPPARDKHRDFMSHHPPTFSHAIDPLDVDDWLKVIGKSWISPSAMTGIRSCMPREDSRVRRPIGGMPSQRHTPMQIL